MTRKEIEIAIKGKDEGAGSLVDSVAQKLKMLKKEARQSGENNLEQLFEGGNLTDGLMKLLGGAKLALAGFVTEQVGESLSEWAEKAAELQKELDEGKITIGEMTDKLAGSVPVFGSVWSAGRAIHDLLAGNTEEIARTNEEAEFTRTKFDAMAESAALFRDQLISTKNELIAMKAELAKMGVGPTASSLIDISTSGEQKQDAISEEFKKRRDDLNKDHNKTTALIVESRNRVAAQLDNIGGSDADWLSPTKFKENQILSKDNDRWAAGAEARYAKQAKALADAESSEKAIAAATNEKQRKQAVRDDPTGLAVKKSGEAASDAMRAAIEAEMRLAGRTYDAELRAIYDRTAQQQRQTIESAEQRISGMKLDQDSAEAKKIMQNAREQSDALGRQGNADAGEVIKQQRTKERDELAAAKSAELSLNGEMLDAQLVQIRASYADRIQAAKTQIEKEALMREQAAAEAEAKRTAAIERADKDYSRRKEIQSVMLAELDDKAATSASAKRAAMKAHIDQETQDRVHELQKIIDDKTSSPEQKAQARAAQARARADAATKEKYIDGSPVEGSRKGVDATLLNDRYHGLAEQYKSGQEPALIEARKLVAQTVHLKTISDNIADIAKRDIAVKGRSVS
jgi:hypothetical protein